MSLIVAHNQQKSRIRLQKSVSSKIATLFGGVSEETFSLVENM